MKKEEEEEKEEEEGTKGQPLDLLATDGSSSARLSSCQECKPSAYAGQPLLLMSTFSVSLCLRGLGAYLSIHVWC